LEFAKSTIEGNIEIGILTPEKYIKNVKSYLAEQEALIGSLSKKLDKKSDHLSRVVKRIALIRNEL
jgi:hypothetical protein